MQPIACGEVRQITSGRIFQNTENMLSSPLRATQSLVLSDRTVTRFAKATARSIDPGIDVDCVAVDFARPLMDSKKFGFPPSPCSPCIPFADQQRSCSFLLSQGRNLALRIGFPNKLTPRVKNYGFDLTRPVYPAKIYK